MEIISYSFFQNALFGAFLASILCAIVGTYIVTRRMVIVGGGMAHASLGGVGLGAFLGFNPLFGAAAFAVATGFSIKWLSRKRTVREDSAIAMLWTFGMALGILFASLTPGFMTDLPSYLFGNILSIGQSDLDWLGGLTIIALIGYGLFRNTIVSIACDRDFARTQGLPVDWVENCLLILTALTIVGCLRMVGIILVVSLLSVPQMTAALMVRTYHGIVLLSGLLAMASCVMGLLLSYTFDVPAGAVIILVEIGLFAIAKLIKR